MENNKYFTPDIDDIHIGYELEVNYNFKLNDIFHKKIIDSFEELSDIHSRMPGDCVIRIPYLTKEQIEAEGWEYVKNTNTVDVEICHIFNKNNYMLGWFPLINKIALLVRDPSKAFDKNGILIEYNNTERYTGSCKDINTFRKLIKLLGI
jgi:hypothetical protein